MYNKYLSWRYKIKSYHIPYGYIDNVFLKKNRIKLIKQIKKSGKKNCNVKDESFYI